MGPFSEMKPKDPTKLEFDFSYSKGTQVGKRKSFDITTSSNGETVTNSISINVGRTGVEFTRDEQTNEINVTGKYGVGVGGKHLGAGAHGASWYSCGCKHRWCWRLNEI
ncbi:hypothetical protein CWO13_11620 [Vibrio sp. ZF 223]|nr:hypothetical protein CWO13_11620 [Vibrio sp. ZF 223]